MIPLLTCQANRGEYERIAREIGISAGALRVAVHRLRERFRECLHTEIRDTVRSEDEVDGELRYLLEVVARAQKAP